MILLIRRFIDICLLRAGPQDLPASRFLTGVTLVMYGAVGLVLALQTVKLPRAVLVVAVDVGLLAGLLFLLLWIRQLLNRYLQALTAFLGTGAVLEVLVMPIVLWQQPAPGSGMGLGITFASLVLWAWLLWGLLVVGHILRHTLSTGLAFGVMLGLLYMFVSFSVMRSLLLATAV
jgi:hypothetical protein